MTRKRFLRLTATVVPASGLLSLVGCGDDDDGDNGETGTTTGGPGTTETTNGETTAPMTTETTGGETTAATTGGPMETTTGAETTAGTGTTAADETGAETTAGVACDAVDADVGGPTMGPPHMHTLEVPAEDVAAGSETTYETSLDAGHFHEVTVTAEMFVQLAAGETVMVDTLADATGHMHPVMLVCA